MAKTTWALVPINTLQRAKSRLAPSLNSKQRQRLHLQLASHVLATLQACRHLHRVIVVNNNDDAISQLARKFDCAEIITNEIGTLNTYQWALKNLPGKPEQLLLIASDLPQVNVDCLDELLIAAVRQDITIVPDKHFSGTNALVSPWPVKLPLAFGNNSYQQHIYNAQHCQLSWGSFTHPRLAWDLDTPGDYHHIAQHNPKWRQPISEAA
ncbi:2-phospho-L-lactate guanylyltransferase [Halioxenophilus aromaticivorans]|uniref:2-phospho-L-lactate guanylyltransferase n=1 Tax=Halioxenophilus aromaticivorans TaxID=1306992 RepID=A0AAV3U3D6_9ALTE